MDIRTKLAFALVFVALVSMAILGTFAYTATASLLQQMSMRQLNSLAESKARGLQRVQEGWRDQLKLIKSRQDLRSQLRQYLQTGDKSALAAVNRIVESAVTAVGDVDSIRILDLQGKQVAGYGKAPQVASPIIPKDVGKIVYNKTVINAGGHPAVVFTALLAIAGKPAGVIEAVFNTKKLLSITDNYTGLGKTGEAMVMMKSSPHTVQMLNPLRHGKSDKLVRMSLSSASAAVRQALSPGVTAKRSLSSVDYRGAHVWAVTRFLPVLRWGLIVKVDKAEERASAEKLKHRLFDIALSLSAFAIIGGTALGFYLARPIHDLAVVVKRIRHGETRLRADASGDDEIAYLAESLNELMDHLQDQSEDYGKHD